ncbi:hypothetical protein D3C81_377400 [compost metagenome]
MAFKQGNADVLGGTRVHGRFKNHDGAPFHVLADGRAGARQGGKIRVVRIVDGRGDGHDNEIGKLQFGRIAAHAQPLRRQQLLRADFAGGVDVAPVTVHLALRQIKADGALARAERHGQLQSHITEAYHRHHARVAIHMLCSDPGATTIRCYEWVRPDCCRLGNSTVAGTAILEQEQGSAAAYRHGRRHSAAC